MAVILITPNRDMKKYYVNRMNHKGEPVTGQLLLKKRPKYGKVMELVDSAEVSACIPREVTEPYVMTLTKPEEWEYPEGADLDAPISGNYMRYMIQYEAEEYPGSELIYSDIINNPAGFEVPYTLETTVQALNGVLSPMFIFEVSGDTIALVTTLSNKTFMSVEITYSWNFGIIIP